MSNFTTLFTQLTGYPPFPWQHALYEHWFAQGRIPDSCNLPTGLGKTSVIAIWLIAIANSANVPRRLVYVVNRRTVVDQTTEEVEKYKVAKVADIPDFAVSTLRGQYADNREWSVDPSRPAVICGTVDMIGSRLLFSGYGVGMRAKPLHAGFLGQDSLLIHDEAHLEPAFQKLIESIRDEQAREREVPWPKLRVLELTATSREAAGAFGLTADDIGNDTVRERMTAVKALHLESLKDPKKLAEQLAARALTFAEKSRAVLVFARTVDDVMKVRDKLPKDRVVTLTGTMRGKERDGLVANPIFQRFLPGGQSDDPTTYLVCTAAGEVGVNISADHLVCDLTPFDSMAQRFGRVNRFGKRTDTEIHVIHSTAFEDKDYHQQRKKTLDLLRDLKGNASPESLGKLDPAARQAAFTPKPTILPATDILFDAWALTSITDKLPGRPHVEPYLHGLPTEWQPPETQVGWREEVKKLQPKYDRDEEREERQYQDRKALAKLAETLLDEYPLKPHELLQDQMTRVREAIDILADSFPNEPAWVIGEDSDVTVTTLHELTLTEKRDGKTVYKVDSRYGTILLPPAIGGLNDQGMLDAIAKPPADDKPNLDVADEWYGDKARTLQLRQRTDSETPPDGMRLLRRLPLPNTGGEEEETEYWYWHVRVGVGDDDASKSARQIVTWDHHTIGVMTAMAGIAKRLFPDNQRFQQVLILAAKWHDLGKKRLVWQRSIGNPDPPDWHAKSGYDSERKRMWKPYELTDYRHEFGSLVDVELEPEFRALDADAKDLILHLIAAHHGRARPHFPPDEAFDPERSLADAEAMAASVPQRFGRLQRQYGRWGLAYLESLLRAADWAASASPSRLFTENVS